MKEPNKNKIKKFNPMARTQSIVKIAFSVGFITIGAYLRIPMPLGDYLTMQLLFIILCGMFFGSALGFISVLLYICIGLIGIPVFAGGGGIGYVLRPSFGYMIGFLLTVLIVGVICKKNKNKKYIVYLIAAITGVFVTYTIGVMYKFIINKYYLGLDITLINILIASISFFLPKDFILCFIGAWIAKILNKEHLIFAKKN